MLLSTGVIAPNTTDEQVEELLRESAAARGLVIDPATIQINMARPGMKIGICEASEE